MKKFLRLVLAAICGVLLANIIGVILLVGMFGSSNEEPVIPASGVLKLDFSKTAIVEQTKENLNIGQNNQQQSVGLLQAIAAVQVAAQDPGVKFLYMKVDGLSMGMGTIYEFRKAIEDFRASGKSVIAYTESPSTGSYYLASAADKVYMGSYLGGNSSMVGIGTQLIFLGDLLDRVGVNVQLIRHGKYKSAGEMYVRSTPSKENLHQNTVMINSIWSTFASQIAASRDISVEKLNSMIDNLELVLPEDFVSAGLADGALSRAQMEERLCVFAGVNDFSQVQMIPFNEYAKAKAATIGNLRARKNIAIIYANGNIVDGYDPENVDGDRFASIVEKVRNDSSVKAVVLRVNSPGGSVVASEKIKNELDSLCAVKPVIASYGDYAASGGYWISNGAAKIYSDPTTLTGSIGVFGMIPDLSKVIKEKAHVGVVSVGSNKHSDMMSLTRPFTPEEMAYMQKGIESVYSKFVNIVAQGRGMSPEAVDEIAQGRVWAGSDALGIGLVDSLGTLTDAIKYAAQVAGDEDLSVWGVKQYPAPMTLIETITAALTGAQQDDYSILAASKWLQDWQNGKRNYVFAVTPYLVQMM